MQEWDPIEGEIDWLTGKYTYKRERPRRALRRVERSIENAS
jgi:hypothetical protein